MMISMGFLQDTPLETRSADVKCAGARPTLGETGGKLRVSARGVRHDVKSVKAFAAEWVSRGSDHADAAQCRFYYLVKQLNRSRQNHRGRAKVGETHPTHRSESSATTHKTRVSASRDALLVIEDKREARLLHRARCTAQEAAAVLCITQYAANQRAVHSLL